MPAMPLLARSGRVVGAVVARQAAAAGGRVEGRTVHLPPGLLPCLGLAELRLHADIAGIEVRP